MEARVQRTLEALKTNGFEVAYYETAREAKAAILSEIEPTKTVGIGGSMTIHQMDLHTELAAKGNAVFWHWLVAPEARNGVRMQASDAQVYLSSSNAITEDGKLINIDGHGNRVASLIYGHETVYIIAGVNKIAIDSSAGVQRIKEDACPRNAERLQLDVPCRYTGKCSDCSSPQRMCNVVVTLEKNPKNAIYKIVLIGEPLGF